MLEVTAPISALISAPPDASPTARRDSTERTAEPRLAPEDCCIAAHDAADCPTASPPSCRFYVAGARCAYGARAPERVPAVPPARALPALDLAERARAERERDLTERKLLHAHCVPTPGIYDDFEANPASALLLLAHNTNLGSFPALQRVQGLRRRRRARWHRLQAQEKGQLVQAKGSSLREHRVLTHDYKYTVPVELERLEDSSHTPEHPTSLAPPSGT